MGRGPATSLFTASVFLGPVLGPLVSGFILKDGDSWRWIFWVMMIFAGICTVIVVPTIPETYAPIILMKKARRLRYSEPVKNKDLYAAHEKGDWSFKGVISRTIFRPFKMLALEPILVLTTVYISIVYGLLYACEYPKIRFASRLILLQCCRLCPLFSSKIVDLQLPRTVLSLSVLA